MSRRVMMSTDASVCEFRGQVTSVQVDAHGSYRAPVESEVGLDVKGSELTGRSWSHRKGAQSRIPTFAHLGFLATTYARGEADVIAGVNIPPQARIISYTLALSSRTVIRIPSPRMRWTGFWEAGLSTSFPLGKKKTIHTQSART
jgi:hypothetical protein